MTAKNAVDVIPAKAGIHGFSDQCSSQTPKPNTDALRGAAVIPLTSVAVCLLEGKELEHCVREGCYQRAAMIGRVALFSIVAEEGRSILALDPVEGEPGGATRPHGWCIEEHRAARNGDSIPGCEAAAVVVLNALNRKCPRPIPRAAVQRRKRRQEAFDRSRGFNPDTSAAERRRRDANAASQACINCSQGLHSFACIIGGWLPREWPDAINPCVAPALALARMLELCLEPPGGNRRIRMSRRSGYRRISLSLTRGDRTPPGSRAVASASR